MLRSITTALLAIPSSRGNSRCGVALPGVVARMRSQVHLDVVHALDLRFSFNGGHFAAVDRQLVMFRWVEVVKLIDAVQNIGNQFFEEQPRRNTDLAAQFAGDGASKNIDVFVGSKAAHSIR